MQDGESLISCRGLVGSLLTAAALLTATGAQAQWFHPRSPATPPPCVLDKCLNDGGAAASSDSAPSRPDRPTFGGVVPSGAFDFYVLALSWSPSFCDLGGSRTSPAQCAPGRGLGFVVHGLWPQNQQGYPSDCNSQARFPSRAALEATRDLYPDLGLARHEWRKHGTCTGLSPGDYFTAVRRARDLVTVPPALRAVSEPQSMAPLDVFRAFAASNPGLRPGMAAVTCRSGELEEVRLCLGKDLRGFVPCPDVARAACRTPSISVAPPG